MVIRKDRHRHLIAIWRQGACRFAFNEMQMLVKKDAGQSFV